MPPPDKSATVQTLAASLPVFQVNSMLFTDMVAATLAAQDPNWGRKVRQAGVWESRNADALAYRMGDDSRKHYVDIVVNSIMPSDPDPKPVPSPAWQVWEGPNEGNGFWMAVPGVVEPAPPSDVQAQIDALVALLAELTTSVSKIAEAVARADRRVSEIDAVAQEALVKGRVAGEDIGKLVTRVTVVENALAQPVRTGQTLYHSHSIIVLPKK